MYIKDNDKDKTDYNSHHGFYHFIRMTFGIRNAPETSQRTMGVIRSSVKRRFAVAYLHDVVICSKTLGLRIEHVRKSLVTSKKCGRRPQTDEL